MEAQLDFPTMQARGANIRVPLHTFAQTPALLSLPLKRANLAGATAIAIAVLWPFNAALIDVPVLDYLVIGNKAISFAERGRL